MTGERFQVIDGGKAETPAPKKRKPRKRSLWPGCQTCEVDIGVRSRVLVDVTNNPEVREDGTIVGGRKVKACAMCLARGKFTPHTL